MWHWEFLPLHSGDDALWLQLRWVKLLFFCFSCLICCPRQGSVNDQKTSCRFSMFNVKVARLTQFQIFHLFIVLYLFLLFVTLPWTWTSQCGLSRFHKHLAKGAADRGLTRVWSPWRVCFSAHSLNGGARKEAKRWILCEQPNYSRSDAPRMTSSQTSGWTFIKVLWISPSDATQATTTIDRSHIGWLRRGSKWIIGTH